MIIGYLLSLSANCCKVKRKGPMCIQNTWVNPKPKVSHLLSSWKLVWGHPQKTILTGRPPPGFLNGRLIRNIWLQKIEPQMSSSKRWSFIITFPNFPTNIFTTHGSQRIQGIQCNFYKENIASSQKWRINFKFHKKVFMVIFSNMQEIQGTSGVKITLSNHCKQKYKKTHRIAGTKTWSYENLRFLQW